MRTDTHVGGHLTAFPEGDEAGSPPFLRGRFRGGGRRRLTYLSFGLKMPNELV